MNHICKRHLTFFCVCKFKNTKKIVARNQFYFLIEIFKNQLNILENYFFSLAFVPFFKLTSRCRSTQPLNGLKTLVAPSLNLYSIHCVALFNWRVAQQKNDPADGHYRSLADAQLTPKSFEWGFSCAFVLTEERWSLSSKCLLKILII